MHGGAVITRYSVPTPRGAVLPRQTDGTSIALRAQHGRQRPARETRHKLAIDEILESTQLDPSSEGKV